MRRFILGALSVATFSFVLSGLIHAPTAEAAKKKSSKKSAKVERKHDEPTEREKKLLGWTSIFPTTWTYMTPDFFVRGTAVDFKKVPNSREYEITVLPIEVLSNPQHHVKEVHYKDGITFKIELQASELKPLRKGGIVEFNQYSKDLAPEGTGHAKLIKSEIHQEFKAYEVAPVAYIAKPGMEPEQVVNAIRGVLMFSGNVEKSDEVKSSLASLTKHKDPNVSQKAKECSAKLFGQ